MKEYNVILKVSLFINTADDVDIDEVVNELDYNFESTIEGASITDTNINDSEVHEFPGKNELQTTRHFPSDPGEDGFYPCRDLVPMTELQKLTAGPDYKHAGLGRRGIMARPTGELRPPKKGEWYLSGAVVEAYRAVSDMSEPLHIAELVPVRRKTIVERL